MWASVKNKKILVVDDDPMIRKIIASMFRRAGNDVITAENGSEALHLFGLGQFDMVITDFQMPGMDGCELAASIKQVAGNTLVIMMTGNNNSKISKALDDKKVDTLLLKPFLLEELLTVVNGVLNQKTTMPPRLKKIAAGTLDVQKSKER